MIEEDKKRMKTKKTTMMTHHSRRSRSRTDRRRPRLRRARVLAFPLFANTAFQRVQECNQSCRCGEGRTAQGRLCALCRSSFILPLTRRGGPRRAPGGQ